MWVLIIILISLSACRSGGPDSLMVVDDVVDREVSLHMFSSVNRGGNEYAMSDFRAKYRNLSLVFLQDGCAPCYPKFIEWHEKMEQIITGEDYTVLFIINARHYSNFIHNARIYGEVEERYYHVMDPNNRFIISNSGIPRYLIDRSLLIDHSNRVRMIGEPFFNSDMTKVFHIVTGVEN